jgi:predicted nuclease of predicted toxin-antitoxin system
VKLMLDEMISAAVAEELRGRDRDIDAVSERRELRGLTDDDLFDYAQRAQRSVVTYNRDDFLELDRRYRGENGRISGSCFSTRAGSRRALHQSVCWSRRWTD